MTPALRIDGLRVEYPLGGGGVLTAVHDVTLSIAPGEIHALVGESGAGKSTVGAAVMGMLERPGRIAAGSVRLLGHEVDAATGEAAGVRQGRDVGAIFQDPMTALNPLFTVESQLCETLRFHLGLRGAPARARALELLRSVGIPEPERRLKAFPHELSGGQRQRVVIAAALSCGPGLLVADEPTTALDVSVQAQILALIRSLARERALGVLLVTHDMGVVAEIADVMTVMRHGRVVESGPTAQVLGAPSHPYVRSLIGAVPRLDRRLDRFPAPDQADAATTAARAALGARVAERAGGPLLEVEGLTVDYAAGGWLPGARGKAFRAVDGVSFTVAEGEVFGVVGESGCGKTTTANVVAGLVSPSAGSVRWRGRPIAQVRRGRARRAIQMIFQDPYSSLNGRLRVGRALAEPILFYRLAGSRAEAEQDAALLLQAVGLEPDMARRFPHAFSGGQRQRLSIARALGARPRLLICDEPTSSLDVSVQAQVLNLLKDLRDATGMALLFISHDLAVVRQMCDRVAVMKAGRIVETAETETLFSQPAHPYTRELLSLIPSLAALDRGAASA